MQKRALGYLLTMIGFGGKVLAGYFFVTGSGGRINLLEVTCYMVVGATCFFTGINFIYDSATTFTDQELPELEDVSPIQQQWRTIHVANRPMIIEINNSKQATAV